MPSFLSGVTHFRSASHLKQLSPTMACIILRISQRGKNHLY